MTRAPSIVNFSKQLRLYFRGRLRPVRQDDDEVMDSDETTQAPAEAETHKITMDRKEALTKWLGTIHILRKHLYSTKLNLTSKFFTKTGFFFVKSKEFHFQQLFEYFCYSLCTKNFKLQHENFVKI